MGTHDSFKLAVASDSSVAQALLAEDVEGLSLVIAGNEAFIYSPSRELLANFLYALGEPEELITRIECLGEESWRDVWQQDLQPLSFDNGRIRIVPYSNKIKSALVLSPGRSFGIGHHPTTSMLIELLCAHREKLRAKHVFDFGCGSGVLSFVALRLGATSTSGCDVDPEAIRVSHENAAQNTIENCDFVLGSESVERFDVLIMNVLSSVTKAHLPKLVSQFHDRAEATIFLSGYLSHEREELEQNLKISILDTRMNNEWGAALCALKLS